MIDGQNSCQCILDTNQWLWRNFFLIHLLKLTLKIALLVGILYSVSHSCPSLVQIVKNWGHLCLRPFKKNCLSFVVDRSVCGNFLWAVCELFFSGLSFAVFQDSHKQNVYQKCLLLPFSPLYVYQCDTESPLLALSSFCSSLHFYPRG